MISLVMIVLLGWGAVIGLACAFQEQMLFYPERLPENHVFEFAGDFRERTFDTEDGERLSALHFRVEEPRGVVLYFHGNAGSLASWGDVAGDFVPLGYDVVVVDYRGYGKSTGKIRHEATLFADAASIYDALVREYGEPQIVLYGRSLGTGVAAKLAADRDPRRLVLETPYYDLPSVGHDHYPLLFPHLFLRYRLPTAEHLERVRCPVDLIHGTRDKVVPYEHSERLQQRHPAVALETIEGGGHNDLRDYPQYHAHLRRILGEFPAGETTRN